MIRFIDYSRDYFEQIEGTAIPQVREGKFVQIGKGDEEYIVFSPKGHCKYHSHIVERFAELKKLAVSVNRNRDAVEFADSHWQITGGGKMKIDDAGKMIYIGGSSQVYGPFQRTGLEDKLTELAQFSKYAVNFAD